MSAPGAGTPSHELFRCFDISGNVLNLYVHPRAWCIDYNIEQYCPIHRPSDHSLKDAKLIWDGTVGRMLRECSHEAWHFDPDDLRAKNMCTRECDGCCRDYIEGEVVEGVRELTNE